MTSLRPRLILVGSVPPPYHGSNIYFQSLLDSHLQRVFEVIHVDTSDHRSLDNIGRFDFQNVYLAFRSLFRLAVVCSRKKPDLVYIPIAQSPLGYLRDGLLIVVGKLFGKARIVAHLHGGDFFTTMYERSHSVFKAFIRFTLQRVDAAVVLGGRLKGVFKGMVNSVHVVSNGINDLCNGTQNVGNHQNGSCTVAYLGNLFRSKGVMEFLEAARLVLEKNASVSFKLAGSWWKNDEDLQAEALQYVRENHLEQQIRFVGPVTGQAKLEFLMGSDILVFPTWYPYEGLPLVILEAMCIGLPVISTADIGAIPDVVVHGKTGLLVDKKNPQQIADAIGQLVDDPVKMTEMGKAARARWEENYTLKKNIDSMMEVFRGTLKGTR